MAVDVATGIVKSVGVVEKTPRPTVGSSHHGCAYYTQLGRLLRSVEGTYLPFSMPISLDFSLSPLAAVLGTPPSQPTTGTHQHCALLNMSLSVPQEHHQEFYFRDGTVTFLV